MNKEEILNASRAENKNKDIYVKEVENKASMFASIAMVLLATFYFIYEIVKGNGTNPAFYSLIAIFNAILYGYMGIKIEESRKTRLFTSIIWLLLTIGLICQYFMV